MRAGIVVRVSSEQQAADDRHSIPQQLKLCREFVARMGWTEERVFEIRGESAFRDELEDRPDFLQALHAAERRELDVLVFFDFSRFSRSNRVTHEVLYRLRRVGVGLYDLTGTDYTQDEDRAVMESWIANRASKDHQRRVKAAYDRLFDLGLPTGDVPFGYRRPMKVDEHGNRVPDTLAAPEIVPEEAEWVRFAYREYARHGSYVQIARAFNEAGLKPRSKSRRISRGIVRPPRTYFTEQAIRSILENDYYIGFVTHRGQVRRGAHQPILTQEEWEAARARRRKGQRSSQHPGLLSGLAQCVFCDEALWAESNGKQKYYRERAKGQLVECQNARAGWRAEEPERLVSEVIGALALDGDWMAYCDAQARRRNRPDPAARRALEEERRRLAYQHRIGALTDDELAEAMAEIRQRAAELPPDIDSIWFAGERVSRFAEAWEIMNAEERRVTVRELLMTVPMDVRGRQLWLKPWPEYEPLFALRREWVLGLARPEGFEHRSPNGLYLPSELVA